MKHWLTSVFLLLPIPATADTVTQPIVDAQILPAFSALQSKTDTLAISAMQDCLTDPASFHAAYSAGFDAWITASIWRFGPTETDARAFSLSFWPDSRGKIPKTIAPLLRSKNADVLRPEAFAQFSIAGKGFYGLDYLLFDPQARTLATPEYRCALAQAITADIQTTTQAISADWHIRFAVQMEAPSARYHTDGEVRQEMFKALTTGLQVIEDLRLGRPLGQFDAPRPRRAEAWRSGRTQRHIELSLVALRHLAVELAAADPALQTKLDNAFGRALNRAETLDDPTLAGVGAPQSRLRIEALKQMVADLRTLTEQDLGRHLGVAIGFNSLDGD